MDIFHEVHQFRQVWHFYLVFDYFIAREWRIVACHQIHHWLSLLGYRSPCITVAGVLHGKPNLCRFVISLKVSQHFWLCLLFGMFRPLKLLRQNLISRLSAFEIMASATLNIASFFRMHMFFGCQKATLFNLCFFTGCFNDYLYSSGRNLLYSTGTTQNKSFRAWNSYDSGWNFTLL